MTYQDIRPLPTNHLFINRRPRTGQSSITQGHYCRWVLYDNNNITGMWCGVMWNVDVGLFCIENTHQASSMESDKLRRRWFRYEPNCTRWIFCLRKRKEKHCTFLAGKYQEHFVLHSYSIIQANITLWFTNQCMITRECENTAIILYYSLFYDFSMSFKYRKPAL